MRLLRHDGAETLSFTEDLSKDRIPPYAILSHRWGPDSDEVKLLDVMNGTAASKPGYDKIKFCMRQAQHDGLSYFWIDTCCIDKSNNTELSKAINSMFRWYQNAEKCYVYLSDVPRSLPAYCDQDNRRDWEHDFLASSWFTRGWTLQELLAPASVDFFSKRGERLGSKTSLERQISIVTGISVKALRGNALSSCTTQERFSWQNNRVTTEEEDRYYSLLGIMDVSMPVIYGEGAQKARKRLEREILYASKGIQPEIFTVTFSLGNVVEVSNFVARRDELEKMREILISDGSRRCIVLQGLGGIGKTQLSMAYAIQYKDNYSAVFWLNIKDDDSIKSSFIRVAKQILREHPSAGRLSSVDLSNDFDAVVDAVKAWLSMPNNTHWLLIFDNYDHPKLPGACSTHPEAVDVRSYLPEAHQGSVIITTRSSEIDIGHCVPITKLDNLQDSLSILASSSQRPDLLQDPDAGRLAQKLDGLPLALATAGAYLRQTPGVRCADYLRHYQDSWAKLQKTSPKLSSYEDRMLYSTWQISFDQIEKQSLPAANLLRLWAYFDNQDLWVELLRHSIEDDPDGLKELLIDELDFHNNVRLLCNHGLVEKDVATDVDIESHGYSIHACVHSWIKTVLTNTWDYRLSRAALCRIALHVPDESSPKWWAISRRLLNHAATFHRASEKESFLSDNDSWIFDSLGSLYRNQGKLDEAGQMYERALLVNEKVFGPDHLSTLPTVNNLGLLYSDQGKLDMAEQMYERALSGYKKALGLDHTSTLNASTLNASTLDTSTINIPMLSTVNNLGILYSDQGRLDKAEQMYEQAVRGYEKALGVDSTATLRTVNNLATLYKNQGKLEEAEHMYERALQGQEKALGPDHLSTLNTVNNLGTLYYNQGRLDEAEQMFMREFEAYTQAHGPDSSLVSQAGIKLLLIYLMQALTHYIHVNKTRSRMVPLLSTPRQSGSIHIWQRLAELHANSEAHLVDNLAAVGRIIMWLEGAGAAGDAVTAFQYFKCLPDGPFCDGCGQRLDGNSTHFVCKSCLEADLCEACFWTYAARIDCDDVEAIPGCADHEYLKVPVVTGSTDTGAKIDGLTAAQWTMRLLQNHVGQAAD